MEEKWIWLDMDGTFADLYAVDGWLEDLQNKNPRPYASARPIYNQSKFIAVLYLLKKRGYKVGVISWLAKNSTPEYDKAVRNAKKDWLKENEIYDLLDSIHIVKYGTNKNTIAKRHKPTFAILVDDEEQNREKWNCGSTIDANYDILKALRKVARG